MIVSCAPFRVSFAGGGSDIAAFYRNNRGAVLSCAIAKYSFIVIHPFFNANKYHLKYTRTELVVLITPHVLNNPAQATEITDEYRRRIPSLEEMLDTLKRMQAGWEAEGRPRIDIGVGVNSGPVLVGNMGSRLRFNYTVMGDNVNLASRLEGLNKEFATRLIISESTYEQVQEKFVARELDFIRVKGKKKPVRIYELLDSIEAYDHYRDLIERFTRGLEEYRSGQWQSAIDAFGELRRDYPEDGPSAVFLERCRDYVAEPPQGIWDGVHVMETK